ncbi:VOC family protein [Lacisediminihabitans changchengi]|uniref:VOC family protein n=1 Tax=Lacisediminihabitans changchengi TaxID=2787634 RepID=A0A934SLZ9_9MICO|nr:VOC family protein [Lacisediminihabitans changchengi]MBK4347062.1 VOC family protein [Lacisediminihabitans changchengi]MBK4347815.1 VOC family protein [Lacisediminihabitans changchengi]
MPSHKQQFNVTLSPDLVRAVKHRAIDEQHSLSDWLEKALTTYLSKESLMTTPPAVTVQPMVHVKNMHASVAFYEALGATIINGSRDGDFVLLAMGETQLSLLAHPANPDQGEGDVELNFESADLAQLEEALSTQDVDIVSSVTDEGFGRQLQLRAPGGLLIKINELDPELYG